MPGLIVNPRARIFHGHEWVYGTEVRKVFGDPQPGSVISLKDFKDRRIGSAIYNPKSQIVARRISRRKQDLDGEFFQRRLSRALELREAGGFGADVPRRLAWSESDGLPGLIVDQYGSHLVVQTTTLAMDLRIELIADTLQTLLNPQSILERNDSPMRKAEGMDVRTGTLRGGDCPPFVVDSGGAKFHVDLLGGQKTGLYLDQLENYETVSRLPVKNKSVLDCFTNQGGFAIACAKSGAASVEGIDISEPAIAAAVTNAGLNQVDLKFTCANVFDELKRRESAGEKHDLIILDPPSFTRNKRSVKDAMRGYKEIHLRALKMLNPDGILVTFSCSHHVGHNDFLHVIQSASVDAKRTLRQLRTFSQRSDHPVIATIPETEYLRGLAYQVIPSW